MSTTSAIPDVGAPRTRWRTLLVVTLLAAAASAATGAVAVRGSVVVSGAAALQRVRFGWPVPWLFQDQRALDPPYPWRMTFLSPWEHPTSAHAGPFVVDVLVMFVPMVLAWLAVRRLRQARSRAGA